MATIVEETTANFADVVQALGDVPLTRILARPAPGTATEEDVVRLCEATNKRLCELVDGVLVEKAMGATESELAIIFAGILYQYVKAHNAGIVLGPDGIMRLFPGQVRMADVAYISWDRLPNRQRFKAPLPDVAPDLAVEFLSLSNTTAEMRRKRSDYFSAGVRLVWEIDWRKRTATVWTSPEQRADIGENDCLDGGDVLPGFSLKLADLLADLDRHG